MNLNHMLALQQFMSRCTLTGAEVNTFATVMNALQTDIASAQKPKNAIADMAATGKTEPGNL